MVWRSVHLSEERRGVFRQFKAAAQGDYSDPGTNRRTLAETRGNSFLRDPGGRAIWQKDDFQSPRAKYFLGCAQAALMQARLDISNFEQQRLAPPRAIWTQS